METHEAKIGPIELSVKDKQTVNVPVWVGVGGTSEPSYLRTSLKSLGVDSDLDIATTPGIASFRLIDDAEGFQCVYLFGSAEGVHRRRRQLAAGVVRRTASRGCSMRRALTAAR